MKINMFINEVIKNKAGTVITCYNKLLNSAELVMNLDVVMMKHSGWTFPMRHIKFYTMGLS